MTITNGYATLAEFKSYATVRGEKASTDTDDDAVIEGIIEWVSRYIDNETGRVFYKDSSDTVRYYTAKDAEILFVDDLVSVTSVHCDSSVDQTYATTLSSTDYDLCPYNAAAIGYPYTWLEMAVNSAESFATTKKGVKITGVFGFPATPTDIKEACLSTALNIYLGRSGQSSAGAVTVTAAGVVIRPAVISPEAQKTIRKYVKGNA